MNEDFTPEFSFDADVQHPPIDEKNDMIGPSEQIIRNILSYSAALMIVHTSAGEMINMILN